MATSNGQRHRIKIKLKRMKKKLNKRADKRVKMTKRIQLSAEEEERAKNLSRLSQSLHQEKEIRHNTSKLHFDQSEAKSGPT